MNYFQFYFTNNPLKMPIKAVRLDEAFLNPAVPNIFGFWVKDGEVRKPSKKLWNGFRPKPFPLAVYPRIDSLAWFTYIKNGNGKVKRITLADWLKTNKRKRK